ALAPACFPLRHPCPHSRLPRVPARPPPTGARFLVEAPGIGRDTPARPGAGVGKRGVDVDARCALRRILGHGVVPLGFDDAIGAAIPESDGMALRGML